MQGRRAAAGRIDGEREAYMSVRVRSATGDRREREAAAGAGCAPPLELHRASEAGDRQGIGRGATAARPAPVPPPAPRLTIAEALRRDRGGLRPRARQLCGETEEASAPACAGQATTAAVGGEDDATGGRRTRRRGRAGEIKATRRRSPDLGRGLP
jgi:hypothetical protein